MLQECIVWLNRTINLLKLEILLKGENVKKIPIFSIIVKYKMLWHAYVSCTLHLQIQEKIQIDSVSYVLQENYYPLL